MFSTLTPHQLLWERGREGGGEKRREEEKGRRRREEKGRRKESRREGKLVTCLSIAVHANNSKFHCNDLMTSEQCQFMLTGEYMIRSAFRFRV